jgi:transposase
MHKSKLFQRRIMSSRMYNTIPTWLTEKQFNQFISIHLMTPSRGPKPKITFYKKFLYMLKVLITGSQWKELVIEKDANGKPEIHYTNIYRTFRRWNTDGSIDRILASSIALLHCHGLLNIDIIHGDGTTEAAKKGGDNIGRNGHKKIKGCKSITFSDRHGNIVAPFLSAPGNKNECALFKRAFAKLKKTAKSIGMTIKDTVISLDGVYNSKANRRLIFNSGMTPNINLRKCDKERSGRPQNFNPGIFEERFRTIERTFAWEDKFKRVLIRFERISAVFDGFKTLAHALINLRHFC